MTSNVLDKIKGVTIVRPSDHVIQQFRNLITQNELKPGDVLPSERDLARIFGIGRSHVREAIKTLELYGVFKSVPGVGAVMADLGMQCITGTINNLVEFGIHNYAELLEARCLLEPFAAYKAASNATDDDLDAIGGILATMETPIESGRADDQLECDFHMEIAKASHYTILANTISAILPGLTKLLAQLDMLWDGRHLVSYEEHAQLYQLLRRRDAPAAEEAMRQHMIQAEAHFSTWVTELRNGNDVLAS